MALIPASWENCEVLSCPKLKSCSKVRQVIKDVAPRTPPGAERITCPTKVKEINILDYDVGNEKLATIIKQETSSTSDIEDIVPPKRRRKSRSNEDEQSYSAMFSKHEPANDTKPTVDNNFESAPTTTSSAAEDTVCSSNMSIVKNEGLESTLALILANVNVLTDEVRKMRSELSEFIKGEKNTRVVVNRRNDSTNQFQFEPIHTVDAAKIFEKLLENYDYEEELMAHFSEDCARSSHLKGNNVSFNLVDKVFTRAFFHDVSWTGIVKKSCRNKVCFSHFVRIRKFFYKLCHSVDNNYSTAMCDEWFKNVAIRTSGARMRVKGTRASRIKNRKRSSAPSKTYDDDSNEDDQAEPKMVEQIVNAINPTLSKLIPDENDELQPTHATSPLGPTYRLHIDARKTPALKSASISESDSNNAYDSDQFQDLIILMPYKIEQDMSE